MKEHPRAFWHRKARALLMPSPFSPGDAAHGKDEIARMARLEDALGATTDTDLLQRCMRDAHDAHVPAGIPGDLPWCEPKHPLINQQLADGKSPAEWFENERELADEAAKIARSSDARQAYVALWRRAMTLGDSMPGSFALPDHSVAAWRNMTAALVGARADNHRAALLYMHIGPVQGFIAASRRTHDLWVGSYTIGYLALQAILAIAEAEGPDAIVYPDLAMLPLAKTLFLPDTQSGRKNDIEHKKDILRSSLANRFLAVVAFDRADALLDHASQRVTEAWNNMAEKARNEIIQAGNDPATDQVRSVFSDKRSGFDPQIENHLDIDAVVQPWPGDRDALIALLDHYDIPPEQRPDIPEADDPERTGGGYGALFDLCHRTLTAYRKTTLPPSMPGDARPKCSQCGQREQMVQRIDGQSGRPLDDCRTFNETLGRRLSESSSQDDNLRISYQLARGEGLCAVCWSKRMAPEAFFGNAAGTLDLDWNKREMDRTLLRFPGVVTIASAPFRHRLLKPPDKPGEDPQDRRNKLAELSRRVTAWLNALDPVLAHDVLKFTKPGNLLYGLREETAHPALRSLAQGMLDHDGEWFYDSNYEPETAWRNHFENDPTEKDAPAKDKQRFKELKQRLIPARQAFVSMRRLVEIEASAYYAVLVLDVDDLGKWLTGRHERTPRLADMLADSARAGDDPGDRRRPLHPALHRELARRLAELAQKFHEIVDKHLGRMVYSGGDDVMAFLPLATALPCARAIFRAMQEELGENVTASAGLAVAHMRMPLGRTLDDARKAEEKAKDRGKNRLTVCVAKRSGAPVDVTIPWRAGAHGLDVVEVLVELLRSSEADGESSRPLSRVDIAYRLEQEFRLLHGDTEPGGESTKQPDRDKEQLAKMLYERMKILLRKGTRGATRARADRLIHCLEPLSGPDRMNLLLLLRFLMREEHGIDTVSLLESIDVWPRQAPEERA